jgi:hypothetical protein
MTQWTIVVCQSHLTIAMLAAPSDRMLGEPSSEVER